MPACTILDNFSAARLGCREPQIAGLLGLCCMLSACAFGTIEALPEAHTASPESTYQIRPQPISPETIDASFPTEPRCQETLRVMTYNIGTGGVPDPNGGNLFLYSDPEPVLEKVANLIVDQQLDIVAIQEIDIGNAQYKNVNMPRMLYDKLIAKSYPMQAHFGPAFDIGFLSGNLVLSRLPFLKSKKVNDAYTGELEPVPSDYIQRTVADESCYDDVAFCNWNFGKNVFTLFSTVQTACGELVVVNYHPFPELADEMGVLLQQALPTHYGDDQILLMGDFNKERGSDIYLNLLQAHTDTCSSGSCLQTVDPAYHPIAIGVDYIFIDKVPKGSYEVPWQAVASQSLLNANDGLVVSDHLPLISEIHYSK